MKLSYCVFLHLEKSNFPWRNTGSSISINSNSSTSLAHSCFSAHLRTPLLHLPLSHTWEMLNPYSPADVNPFRAAFLRCWRGCSKVWERRERAEGEIQPLARRSAGHVWAPHHVTQPGQWSRQPQEHATSANSSWLSLEKEYWGVIRTKALCLGTQV